MNDLAATDCGGHRTENVERLLGLLTNVHVGLPFPPEPCVKSATVRGDYAYFHYGCDGQDDRGWGCGYRTVQTMASWLFHNCSLSKGRHVLAPSLSDMQRALVSVGDKPEHFCGSREWIGTVEAALILDYFYDVPCKLVYVRGGAELESAMEQLYQHFQQHGSPVLMGGGTDNSSKGVLGLCTGESGSHVLIADPHYYGGKLEREDLQGRGWVGWRKLSSLDLSSFYNLCLPQTQSLLGD